MCPFFHDNEKKSQTNFDCRPIALSSFSPSTCFFVFGEIKQTPATQFINEKFSIVKQICRGISEKWKSRTEKKVFSV
jgi:hypothetical protein